MKSKIFTALVAGTLGVVAAFAAPVARAVDGRFSLSTGYGNYGTSSATDTFPIPVTGKYETGHSTFKLNAPYVRISGMEGVIPGMGVTGVGTTSNTQSGLGDTVAAATYSIYEDTASNFKVDLTGKAKLATAIEGIGGRAHDYAAQADVYQGFDKFTAMGSLGSKVVGHTGGLTLNTVLYGSFGGAYQFAKQASGGVNVSSIQNTSTTLIEQQELTAYVDYKIDKVLKVQGYVLKGLSSDSPIRGVGAFLSSKF